MPKINILPPQVYNRIAAGEVIERPSSVVKELVENALDAGATEIEIYVERAGLDSIRIADNGSGMDRSDLQSAFLPHATSKLKDADDLQSILTLGFRGEAIPSISAVSRMTITTQAEGGKCYRLTVAGDEFGEIKEVSAGARGTEVCVENLFFNTPVRLGFLRTENKEEADITGCIARFILCYPHIFFTYYLNGKKTLQSFGGSMDEAFLGVYDTKMLSQCYKIDAERNGIRMRGYLGIPQYTKANRSYQTVFLNGRFVQNVTIETAMHAAYSPYMQKRKHPVYVVYLEIPREVVDVNVHPSKADVRFANNGLVFGTIQSIVGGILAGKASAVDFILAAPAPLKAVDFEVEQTQLFEEESALPATSVSSAPSATLDFSDLPNFSDMPSASFSPTPAFSRSADISVEEKETAKTSVPPVMPSVNLSESILSYEEEKVEKTGAEKEKNVSPSVFTNEKVFTYEEAKREIEESSPVFTAKQKGEDEDESWKKGFTPAEQIGEVDPKSLLTMTVEEMNRRRAKKRDAEKLHKKYPDVYFKTSYLEVDDSGAEKPKMDEETGEIDYFAENKKYLEELEKNAKQNKIDVLGCKYAGKLFNTYLLYERGDEVFIIDQHAAHERLIYDKLREKVKNRTVIRQSMLVPYELQLNAFEASFMREHLPAIRELGFDITESGEKSFSVYAVPLDLQSINLTVFFNGILADLNGYRGIKLEEILKDKLASAACKAAVKGGMDLTEEEIESLFALMDGDMGLKCPHGRPVVVRMTKTQLEKMFKRIV